MRRQRKYFVAIAVIVMTTAFSFSQGKNGKLGDILMPVQKAAAEAEDKIVDIIRKFRDYDSLASENEELREELGEARSVMAELWSLEEENAMLRDKLKLTERDSGLELLPAKITGGISGLQIDKGRSDGAEMYMAVVTVDGLLGFISEMGDNWSSITPIDSKSFIVGGSNCNTRETGVLVGGGGLYLKFLLPTSVTREGDLITTGGGGNFPKGIVVGTVESVSDEENGLSRTAKIDPAVDISKINDVFVVVGWDD